MAFGISGSDSQHLMVGADVVVVYYIEDDAIVTDYYLSDYSQVLPKYMYIIQNG